MPSTDGERSASCTALNRMTPTCLKLSGADGPPGPGVPGPPGGIGRVGSETSAPDAPLRSALKFAVPERLSMHCPGVSNGDVPGTMPAICRTLSVKRRETL